VYVNSAVERGGSGETKNFLIFVETKREWGELYEVKGL
jgi:hypothetical protein